MFQNIGSECVECRRISSLFIIYYFFFLTYFLLSSLPSPSCFLESDSHTCVNLSYTAGTSNYLSSVLDFFRFLVIVSDPFTQREIATVFLLLYTVIKIGDIFWRERCRPLIGNKSWRSAESSYGPLRQQITMRMLSRLSPAYLIFNLIF